MSALLRDEVDEVDGVLDWKFGFTELKNTVYRLKDHYWNHFRISITAFWHKEVKKSGSKNISFHLFVLGFCFRLLSLYYTGQLGRNYGLGHEADQIWPCMLMGGLQCLNSFYVTICAYTSPTHPSSSLLHSRTADLIKRMNRSRFVLRTPLRVNT